MNLDELLAKHWGVTSFRAGQKEAVEAVVHRRDNVMVVMPTGGGKSLCYQLAAIAMAPKTCIVITPLVALMQDQVSSLLDKEVSACFLGSAQTDRSIQSTCFERGRHTFVYMSPEYAVNNKVMPCADDVSLVVVDEAHCICEWGTDDFRPDYSKIGTSVLPLFCGVPVMALTATASPSMQARIVESLWPDGEPSNLFRVQLSFFRPNLRVHTVPLHENVAGNKRRGCCGQALRRCIMSHASPVLVYANTRADVDSIHQSLSDNLSSVVKYHGGMTFEERRESHEAFLSDRVRTMIATVAYGMGIDKPNIRTVVHWGMPSTLEMYYQQIGRAGRDGKPSHCVMFYRDDDHDISTHAILSGKTEMCPAVNEVVALCATRACKHAVLMRHFGEGPPVCDGACDNCSRKTLESPDVGEKEELDLLVRVVQKTGGRCSSSKVIKMLQGKVEPREASAWEQKLGKDYGAGKLLPREWWQRLIHSAVEKGLVAYCFIAFQPPHGHFRKNKTYAALRLNH